MNEKNIFVSYAHGEHDSLVARFVEDLRKEGFNVFFDNDYLQQGDWERIIDEHILSCSHMVFMVSASSVSCERYCLNELTRALEKGLTVIPVTLDDSDVPLSIVKYERLPVAGEDSYKRTLQKVLDIISGKARLGFAEVDALLKDRLKPVSSEIQLSLHCSSFEGREAVFDEFEDFVDGDGRIWWIPALPGTGKTAFSTMLCRKYESLIDAAHFCKFNNSDRTDAKRIFMTLAYGLSQALPEYKERLFRLNELDSLMDKNADAVYEYLLVQPLHGLNPDRKHVLLIDALDEASFGGRNEVSMALQKACSQNTIPSWLKFVVTSRNEAEVSSYLESVAVRSRSFDESTDDGIRKYYQANFKDISDESLNILLNKSEGSFLYAVEIVKQVKDGILELGNINMFPPGIRGFYNDCMNRIFDEKKGAKISFEEAKQTLAFICIYSDPLTRDFLMEVLERALQKDEYFVRNFLSAFRGLFPERGDVIEPIHKSLIDWLTDSTDLDMKYYVSRKDGYDVLCRYLTPLYEKSSFRNECLLKYYGRTLVELKNDDKLKEVLGNYRFVSLRIKKLHFDAGLRGYLQEMAEGGVSDAVFETETFRRIFQEHRRLLYNSGMFFILRDLDFSGFLSDVGTGDFVLEGQIGIAFYYYIVEEFENAIRQCTKLLESEEIENIPIYAAELYNIKGLSERKLVRFDDAILSFETAIDRAKKACEAAPVEHSDPEYEQSMAYLLLGKIYTNLLDFDKADESFDNSTRILKEKIDRLEGDDRTAKILFLAEEYRVYAYSCIWEGRYEKAASLLDSCDAIYKENRTSTDRYFLRYQYTSCMLSIMTGNSAGLSERLSSLLAEAKGKYDIGMINTYLGILAAMEGNPGCLDYLSQAQRIFGGINAYLEQHEARLVESIYRKTASGEADAACGVMNDYIRIWIDYARGILEALIRPQG